MANTTDSLTSTPDCLRRTVSDDRAEAQVGAYDHAFATAGANWGEEFDNTFRLYVNVALAAIQRREADAVYGVCAGVGVPSAAIPNDREAHGHRARTIFRAAWVAAEAAWKSTREAGLGHPSLPVSEPFTLAQRATLLDCARRLVALAIAVSS